MLRHLQIYTKTLLENNLAVLDRTNCSHIGVASSDRDGYVSRLIVSSFDQVQDSDAETGKHLKRDRARANHFQARLEENPFPDASLLNPIEDNQDEAIRAAADSMLKTAQENGLSKTDTLYLRQAVTNFIDIFRVLFSAGPPASIIPLKIELKSDARPVRARLRNYTQEQRPFLTYILNSLRRHGMVYSNPTSP